MLIINLSNCPAQREIAQWTCSEIAADCLAERQRSLWGKVYRKTPARCGLDGVLSIVPDENLVDDFLWRIETLLVNDAAADNFNRYMRTIHSVVNLSNKIRAAAGFEPITRKSLYI